MTASFSQHFEIIYNKFKLQARAKGEPDSRLALARFLGVSHGKMQAWERGQWPSAMDCAQMERLLGFNLRWLVTGEGDPESPGEHVAMPEPVAQPLRPVPLLGLASCGINGWNQRMPIAVSASPLMQGERMVAVVAAGESMVPAGIASGQVCYCDPDQQILEGDAVYVERTDGYANIKLYLGQAERAGWIRLKGWLDPDEHQRRKEFYIDIMREQISLIAPVIYVRRRL